MYNLCMAFIFVMRERKDIEIIYLSVYLTISPTISLSPCLSLPINLSIYSSIYPFIHPPIHITIYPFQREMERDNLYICTFATYYVYIYVVYLHFLYSHLSPFIIFTYTTQNNVLETGFFRHIDIIKNSFTSVRKPCSNRSPFNVKLLWSQAPKNSGSQFVHRDVMI